MPIDSIQSNPIFTKQKTKASEPDFSQKIKSHGFGSPSVFTRLRANSHSQIDPKPTKSNTSRLHLNGKNVPPSENSPKSLGKEKTKPRLVVEGAEKVTRNIRKPSPNNGIGEQSKLQTPPKTTQYKGSTTAKSHSNSALSDGLTPPTSLLQAQYHTSSELKSTPRKSIGPNPPLGLNIARKNLTPKASPGTSPVRRTMESQKSNGTASGNATPIGHSSSPQAFSNNDTTTLSSKGSSLMQSKFRSTPNKAKTPKLSATKYDAPDSSLTAGDSLSNIETKSYLGLTNIKVPHKSVKGHSMISTPVKESSTKSSKTYPVHSNQSPTGRKSNNTASGTPNSSSRTSSGHDFLGKSLNHSMSEMEVANKAMDPLTVLKANAHKLSLYERGEILEYPHVYFYGDNIIKKAVKGDGSTNFGYDDERGDYQIVLHDHLIYRYEIVEILGKGSFGQVIKAYDHKTDEVVAIKIIRNKSRFHTQALIEVKILESIRKWDPDDTHNLVHMHDHFYFRNHLCIAFELLSINLYEFIKSNSFKGCSINLIRRFTIQIIRSLILLSKHRVIHCDLKPENILLKSTSKSAIKVIDLGSSCLETERVYTYIQSRFYRSPEVILGMPYSMAIDMWSLGCILGELYTGYPLFPGENEKEQLSCILEILGVPAQSLIDKCTRKSSFFESDGTPKTVINSKGKRRYPGTKILTQVLRCTDEPFLDFITRCLEWDPEKRIKPDEAMQHRWIVATNNDPRLVQPRATTPRTSSNPSTPQQARKVPSKNTKDFKYTSPHVTPCSSVTLSSRNQAESAGPNHPSSISKTNSSYTYDTARKQTSNTYAHT
ncbi:serine/threonine protein kinase, CMGC, dual-specificity, variant 2 [Basidiobolus ranarum]|uniref:dual-specificity kinase n=1 Tax=Basidiobolus ranarum TaxID=34480 RepID=A0ABR2X3A8_9FUNG